MTDTPFLIAHRVRGEPTFDIAIQQPCAICNATGNDSWDEGCVECDGLGFWWICSTSGHRAYPFWSEALSKLGYPEQIGDDSILDCPGEMPEGLVDHYRVNTSPRAKVAEVGRSLLAKLGLSKPALPIKRRI